MCIIALGHTYLGIKLLGHGTWQGPTLQAMPN